MINKNTLSNSINIERNFRKNILENRKYFCWYIIDLTEFVFSEKVSLR